MWRIMTSRCFCIIAASSGNHFENISKPSQNCFSVSLVLVAITLVKGKRTRNKRALTFIQLTTHVEIPSYISFLRASQPCMSLDWPSEKAHDRLLAKLANIVASSFQIRGKMQMTFTVGHPPTITIFTASSVFKGKLFEFAKACLNVKRHVGIRYLLILGLVTI